MRRTPIQHVSARAHQARSAYKAVTFERVPSRYVLHHDHDGWWVYHEKEGLCTRRGDEYCRGISGSSVSTGIGDGYFTKFFADADERARSRFEDFIREAQQRGKDFGS